MIGSGYKGIFHGKKPSPFLFRKMMSPIAPPMNWTNARIATIALIISLILNNSEKIHAIAQRTMSETCGKCSVGCTRENSEKNAPSFAAAYGMRE